MLATASERVPVGDDWAFEFKWDGVRAIGYWDGRRLTLSSRNQLDITTNYPELQALGEALGPDRRVVLDGEIVALDDLDRPSFTQLQRRMKVTDPAIAMRLSREVPVYYIIFDLLHLDGRSTMSLPLSERRVLLEGLTLQGANWQVSPAHAGQGQAMFDAARAAMLEGIVAKHLDGIYEPGRRSSDWLKIKLVLRQEFVVGGYTAEKDAGGEGLGALQVGYYDEHGKLRYAGAVGSGFTNATVHSLLKLLRERHTSASPFLDRLPKRDVRWVTPSLVVEVEYRRWADGGMLQQAAFKGLRFDKDPRHVVKELNACMMEKKEATKERPGTKERRREGTRGGRRGAG